MLELVWQAVRLTRPDPYVMLFSNLAVRSFLLVSLAIWISEADAAGPLVTGLDAAVTYGRQSKLVTPPDANGFGEAVFFGTQDVLSVDAFAAYTSTIGSDAWSRVPAGRQNEFDLGGRHAALDGDTLLVGAEYDPVSLVGMRGNAFVFTRTLDGWAPQATLQPDVPGSTGENFGAAVALQGDVAWVSATELDDSGDDVGGVYLFRRSGQAWTLEARLAPPEDAVQSSFGSALAFDGDTLLVGAKAADGGSGAAYVYREGVTGWELESRLVPTVGAGPHSFGYAVALVGEVALIGAPGAHGGGDTNGSAHVFRRTGTTWTEDAWLRAGSSAALDQDLFGLAVALSGDMAVVGARRTPGMDPTEGAVYVFRQDGAQWHGLLKLLAGDGAIYGNFGRGVSLRDEDLLVGSSRGVYLLRDLSLFVGNFE